MSGNDETLARASGAPTPHSVSPALPRPFGRYNLLRALGRGGMGEVYLAFDSLLQRNVAIKMPRSETSLTNEQKERFYREARAAARLQHPNLCAVFDVGDIEGQLFLAMPFIAGESLAEVLRRGPLPPARATSIARQVALAMQEAQALGILHRDLKPGNIMLNERGEPIVMDFGLARLHEHGHDLQLTGTGVMLGTPAYAAPEQLQDDVASLGPACDIYSLGVVLFEMLTGRPPFTGSLASVVKQVLVDPPERPSNLVGNLDPRLEAACLRALAKNPAQRYASMAEFAAALPPSTDLPATTQLSAATVAAQDVSPASKAEPFASPPPKPGKNGSGWRWALLGCVGASVATLAACVGICSWVSAVLPDMAEKTMRDFQADPNWEDLARLWQPPAEMPPDFATVDIAGYTLEDQSDVDEIDGFAVKLPARHATFSQTGKGNVELYIAKASELEREAVYRKVWAIIEQQDDRNRSPGEIQDITSEDPNLPDYPYYPDRSRSGSVATRYLRYQHRKDFKAPGDAAVFWWDDNWLFLARSHTEVDPRFFLRDVLVALQKAQ
jgi:hypothetical protein